MSRSKLAKFRTIEERANVMEPSKPDYGKLAGRWNEAFFKENQEIVLEIGCGKGEYTVGMGRIFPHKNFLGIDIKGARLWKGSTLAEEEYLQNVGFMRTFVERLPEHFAEQEVSEIWITFPDPRPKKGDVKKRLTAPNFLNMYQKLLKPEGIVNFKTDNHDLFEYTLEVLKERGVKDLEYTFDLYQSAFQNLTLGIQTTYEKKFLAEGVPIKFLRFRF